MGTVLQLQHVQLVRTFSSQTDQRGILYEMKNNFQVTEPLTELQLNEISPTRN